MSRNAITRLLRALREGGHGAVEALLPLIYDELHGMAHRRLTPGAREPTLERASARNGSSILRGGFACARMGRT